MQKEGGLFIVFGHLPASLKVKVQERAVGAAHHIGGGDHQQRQNGGTAGDGILFEQVPNLLNERGAAEDADHQQHTVVAQEVQRRNTAGRNEQLVEQQTEAYARIVAHEHGPAHHHEEQGVDVGPHSALLQVGQQEQLFYSQQHKVVQAPADKVPVRAVPDAGEQLHHEQVEDLALQALAVAAERDIHILPEPAGKGHVPAPPELGDGCGDIRVVEVCGEVEAQHLAHANAHHGVAGKVKVELQAVGDDAQPHQRGGCIGKAHKGGGRAVRNADDVCPQSTDGIRQQHLFGKAKGEQGHALFDLLQAVAVPVYVQLVRDIAVFHDGAGDQLREHDHIGTKVDDITLCLYIPAVNIDGVGKGLEGVKADAQRQSANALDLGKGGAQQGVCAAQHKVCVFEVEQHPKAANEGHQQKCPAQGRLLVEVLDAQAADVVDEDEGHHDREKPYLAPAVEHQTAEEQHGVLELCGRKVIQRQRDGQKPEQKDDGAENQSVSLLLAEKSRCRKWHRPWVDPDSVCQCAVHGAVQIGSALVGCDHHDNGVALEGDDSVLHVILRLSKLGVVAVEGHLILLVGSQLVGYVLGLAVGSFEHQHQTGIAVVVALHALVAHHVLSLQAEIV